uniref:Uncharacterized protein n=1 Tax=Parascaris univalens TaxID=6257 RepID=A0A915CFJ1_PARUN
MCIWRKKFKLKRLSEGKNDRSTAPSQQLANPVQSVEPIEVKKSEPPIEQKASGLQREEKPSPEVKVREEKVENDTDKKSGMKSSEKFSELNTLKGVPGKMPIMDVLHDQTKKDKYYTSEELL